MKTIGERIKLIMEHEKLNDYSFSKKVGKSNTAITKIVKGETKPGFEIIEAVLTQFPYVSSNWLVKGEGGMFLEKEQKVMKEDTYLHDYLKQLEEKFEKLLFQKDKLIESQQYLIERLTGQVGKLEDVIEETQIVPLWREALEAEQAYA